MMQQESDKSDEYYFILVTRSTSLACITVILKARNACYEANLFLFSAELREAKKAARY